MFGCSPSPCSGTLVEGRVCKSRKRSSAGEVLHEAAEFAVGARQKNLLRHRLAVGKEALQASAGQLESVTPLTWRSPRAFGRSDRGRCVGQSTRTDGMRRLLEHWCHGQRNPFRVAAEAQPDDQYDCRLMGRIHQLPAACESDWSWARNPLSDVVGDRCRGTCGEIVSD